MFCLDDSDTFNFHTQKLEIKEHSVTMYKITFAYLSTQVKKNEQTPLTVRTWQDALFLLESV